MTDGCSQVEESATNDSDIRALPYVLAIHAFCSVDPSLCAPASDPSRFAVTLQPYLKTQVCVFRPLFWKWCADWLRMFSYPILWVSQGVPWCIAFWWFCYEELTDTFSMSSCESLAIRNCTCIFSKYIISVYITGELVRAKEPSLNSSGSFIVLVSPVFNELLQ